MKNLAFVLLFMFVSFGVFAQKRGDFKGPAYKNYKPWLHKSETTLVYSVSKKEQLTGPAYKNKKPWQNKSQKTYVPIVFGSERSKLTGPAYKNYKPWRKSKA
ncbi:hypothetical protein [Litoribaculum gwangyangense]|uniref:Uncharacterized protein n=1 Tax=Litoribaculum gwangyangense TaxID=1130722 RepID=A0ABP9BYL3_9FLAO